MVGYNLKVEFQVEIGASMKVLVYRYNSIYEPDVISVFKSFGLDVIEECVEMTDKKITSGERVKMIADYIISAREKNDPLLFVFSINFYPAISEICEKLDTIYACWSVDCPVIELFFNAIKNKHNRVFLFDRTQYERFAPYNPENIFYLPLATNVDRQDAVIDSITDNDRKRFSADISFVGSLYNEKNKLKEMDMDDYSKGYIDGLIQAQLPVYGCNFIESALDDKVVEALKGETIKLDDPNVVEPIDRFYAAHNLIGMQLAEVERIQTLNMLAQDFNVDLYTQSDTSPLQNVHVKGPAKSLSEMPKVFHLSKINLNITMRPIQTGLPLRIFDVLGCGGFLITNYQAEIPDLFEIGVDLETYSSMEELHQKCAYYLEHEDERKQIAENGYRKVKQLHDCKQRMQTMLSYMIH